MIGLLPPENTHNSDQCTVVLVGLFVLGQITIANVHLRYKSTFIKEETVYQDRKPLGRGAIMDVLTKAGIERRWAVLYGSFVMHGEFHFDGTNNIGRTSTSTAETLKIEQAQVHAKNYVNIITPGALVPDNNDTEAIAVIGTAAQLLTKDTAAYGLVLTKQDDNSVVVTSIPCIASKLEVKPMRRARNTTERLREIMEAMTSGEMKDRNKETLAILSRIHSVADSQNVTSALATELQEGERDVQKRCSMPVFLMPTGGSVQKANSTLLQVMT